MAARRMFTISNEFIFLKEKKESDYALYFCCSRILFKKSKL